MLNGRLAFDLETIPEALYVRETLATPYDPSTFAVQHGAKDPEKIEAQKRAHEATHHERLAELAAKGSLSGLTGRIACWGWATDRQAESHLVETEAQEAQAVNDLLFILGDNALSSWNGRSFDLPFLLLRAAVLGVSVPAGLTRDWFTRWETGRHFDGYAALKYKTGESWSLERIAQRLSIEPVGLGKGSEIAGLFAAGDFDTIRAKNLQDVRRTLRVNAILESAFPV